MKKKNSFIKSLFSKVKSKVLSVSPNAFKIEGNIFFVKFKAGLIESKEGKASSLVNVKIFIFNKPVVDFTLGKKDSK